MLYLDLDGVLADFDAHVRALFGVSPDRLRPAELWAKAAGVPGFFETMPPTSDAFELWEFCRPFEPTILTGLPHGKWAGPQKREWVRQHLGAEVPVITCLSREKHLHASPGDILVDDRKNLADPWRRRGGRFILHRSAADSIAGLKRLGIEAGDPASEGPASGEGPRGG